MRSFPSSVVLPLALLACSHEVELDEIERARSLRPDQDPVKVCELRINQPQQQASFGLELDADPQRPGLQIALSVQVSSCAPQPLRSGLCRRDSLGTPLAPEPWESELPVSQDGTYSVHVTLSDASGAQQPCVAMDSLVAVTVQRTCNAPEQLCMSDQSCHTDTATNAKFCGSSCEPCAGGPHGEPACRAGKCELRCNEGYRYEAGQCRARPSCKGLETACNGQDCCAADLIAPEPGEALRVILGNDASGDRTELTSFQPSSAEPVVVEPFYLDRYEVTVGRFRRFVDGYEAWLAGANPKPYMGENPRAPGSGWRTEWSDVTYPAGSAITNPLPRTRAELVAALASSACAGFHTWTEVAGENERRPINCVDFFVSYLFCIWDSDSSYSRLPSEAEWQLAASGGLQQRAYPWSTGPNFGSLATEGKAVFGENDHLPYDVGSFPDGAGRWSTLDLAGNVFEWTRDSGFGRPIDPATGQLATSYNPYLADRDDPLNLMSDGDPHQSRVLRGGSFKRPNCACSPAIKLRNVARTILYPNERYNDIGLRCVRSF